MPILDIDRSLRRLGKIRMGDQRQSENGKMHPAKLAEWRLTSPSRQYLEDAATVYGGEVRQWEGSPNEGDEWELYTASDRLDIVIPPVKSFQQWYELWSKGGCQRRCDGFKEQLSGERCLCPADFEERREAANKGEACKMTTRLSVILLRLPDVGTWMLETHGYYAAVELAGTEEILRLAGSQMVPAVLRIDQRTAKRKGKTLRYAVPVVELPTLTAGSLLVGAPAAPALPSGAEQPAIASGGGRAAEEDDSRADVEQPTPAGTIDGWDKDELVWRIGKLDVEHRQMAQRAFSSAGIPWPTKRGDEVIVRITDDQADEATSILMDSADKQRIAYEHRRVAACSACSEVGVKSADARHALIREATGGETESSKALTADQLERIKARCAALAAADASESEEVTTA